MRKINTKNLTLVQTKYKGGNVSQKDHQNLPDNKKNIKGKDDTLSINIWLVVWNFFFPYIWIYLE
jgi:hypothetical protein